MSGRYYLFDGSREGFDDGEGGSVTLGEHLDYIFSYSGTPDCYDVYEGSEFQVKKYAREQNFPVYIVCTTQERVVYKVNF